MKVTLNWLKEFVSIRKAPLELAEALTCAGLPVASIEDPAKAFDGVVTGRISKIDKHPNADKLTVCRVDVGKDILKIVCGAKNMKEQDIVPVATIGTVLPCGMRIEQAAIRGETSFGMMCSRRELGLGEGHDGLYILDGGTPVGRPLAQVLGLDDVVLDVEVTPNRSDCLSVLGVAREIAAITNTPLRTRAPFRPPKMAVHASGFRIRIEAKDQCWMYCGCLLENVQVQASPEWLKKRLELVGLRSVNNVVDITNYVLLGLGHPLHAFDADTLTQSQIVVRLAKSGESIVTIDQVTRALAPETLVIADASKPVAVAGVMGGARTEISSSTKRMFLESALFAPQSIRRASKKLGLASDSSYRFERGVDPENVEMAMKEAIRMLVELAGAKPGPIQKVAARKFSSRKIVVDTDQICDLLGVKSSRTEICDVLGRLNFHPTKQVGQKITATIPSYRLDVSDMADVAEEFARINGYDKIPASVPSAFVGASSGSVLPDEIVRQTLLGKGFTEVINLSFIGAKRYDRIREVARWGYAPVEVDNPLDQDQRFLRPTLVDALLDNCALNQNRGMEQSMIFEIGSVFGVSCGKDKEKKMLGITGMGSLPMIQWEGKSRLFDFYDLKGALEELIGVLRADGVVFRSVQSSEPAPGCVENLGIFQPGQVCALEYQGRTIGMMGKVHPALTALYDLRTPIFLCELELDGLLAGAGTTKLFYRSLSKYPSVVRDIAIVLDRQVAVGDVQSLLTRHCGEILEGVFFFDLYEGKNIPSGKKSLAFRLIYRRQDRTLTEQEVQAEHENILGELKTAWGCELRESK